MKKLKCSQGNDKRNLQSIREMGEPVLDIIIHQEYQIRIIEENNLMRYLSGELLNQLTLLLTNMANS